MNFEDSGSHRLSTGSTMFNGWPPNRSRIAFARFNRDFRSEPDESVVNANGTSFENLTNEPAADADVVWSPRP